jgi:hypothetical protein
LKVFLAIILTASALISIFVISDWKRWIGVGVISAFCVVLAIVDTKKTSTTKNEKIKSLTIPEDRELTPTETALLQWLLSSSRQDLESYRCQIPFVRVVGSCACGCATIGLKLNPGVVRGSELSGGIVADAYGKSPSGHYIEVILHQNEGELSELEIVWFDGPVSKWIPQPADLTLH